MAISSSTTKRGFAYSQPQVEQKTYQQQPKPAYQQPYSNNRDTNRQPQQPAREQRDLRVRKITNDTPLPPRRVEPRREEPDRREAARDGVYSDNRKIEEQFHKPPHVVQKQTDRYTAPYQDERESKEESPLKGMSVPVFDDKPAMSLKDALAKAMHDHGGEKLEREERELKVRKEVDEDVLRKLIEDQ